METCNVKQFEESYKAYAEPNAVLKLQSELKQLQKRLPQDIDLKEDCAGLVFREQYKDIIINATVILCSNTKDQNKNLRLSLGMQYDQASRSIDIHKQVVLATTEQTFEIHIMDNDNGKVLKNVNIQLGEKALIDLDTSKKIIKYS